VGIIVNLQALAADLSELQRITVPEGSATERINHAREAIRDLAPFIGRDQRLCMMEGLRGEEWQFFADKAVELLRLTMQMPKTYETDGQGRAAIAHLHYFAGGQGNWYVTEKDKGDPDDEKEGIPPQSQAFGLADILGDGGELGYINIAELLSVGAELDFYWTPKPLNEINHD
jgi:hypothetical protein